MPLKILLSVQSHLRISWCPVIFVWMTLLVAGCGTPPPRLPVVTQEKPVEIGRIALQIAQELIGKPYVWGGESPDGIDCSGLVRYSYQRLGVELPRTSFEQFQSAWPVELSEAQAGDLLFFRAPGRETVNHVGIYDGHGGFVHAASKRQQVTYSSLENPYWQTQLVRVGRVF